MLVKSQTRLTCSNFVYRSALPPYWQVGIPICKGGASVQRVVNSNMRYRFKSCTHLCRHNEIWVEKEDEDSNKAAH